MLTSEDITQIFSCMLFIHVYLVFWKAMSMYFIGDCTVNKLPIQSVLKFQWIFFLAINYQLSWLFGKKKIPNIFSVNISVFFNICIFIWRSSSDLEGD